MDKTWHPEHFACEQCGKLFGEGGFHEKDGRAYCRLAYIFYSLTAAPLPTETLYSLHKTRFFREDYFDMFAPKCGGCCQPIMDNYISALNCQWHPECFVCYVSLSSFPSINEDGHISLMTPPFAGMPYALWNGELF